MENQIRDAMYSGMPFAVGRLGATECEIAYECCRMHLGIQDSFSENAIQWLCTTSGFFTRQERAKEDIAQYANMTISALKNMDIHLVWGKMVRPFC